MMVDLINLILRILILVPLISFLIYQYRLRHLNGKFHLIRRFTYSVSIAFIIYVVEFLVTRLINIIFDIPLLANRLQIILIVSHVITLLLLIDAGETMKKIIKQTQ